MPFKKGFPNKLKFFLSIFQFKVGYQDSDKTFGNSSSYSEANQHQNRYILRQHVVNELGNSGSEDDQKHILKSFQE